MKSLILISLFILISSKLEEIEYAKDLPFEKGKSFYFTTVKDGTVFLKCFTTVQTKSTLQ